MLCSVIITWCAEEGDKRNQVWHGQQPIKRSIFLFHWANGGITDWGHFNAKVHVRQIKLVSDSVYFPHNIVSVKYVFSASSWSKLPFQEKGGIASVIILKVLPEFWHKFIFDCIGTYQSWRAKLVSIIRLRIYITLDPDINGVARLLGALTVVRDTRLLISLFAHSRALREATAMDLWEIHPRGQTPQQKRFLQHSLFIWCGFF